MASNGATRADLRGGVKDEPGSLRVLQVTDTHLFGDARGRLVGVDTEATYAAVMDRVLSDCWPVDLVLATGDIAHDGSERAYNRFKSHFEDLAVRTLVIPGNHDEPGVMRRVFNTGRVSWSGNAVLGNWQFLMLDSVIPGQPGGRLDDAELERLDRCLAAHPQQHALIALHHHPVALDSQWIDTIGVDNGAALLEIVDRHPQVRAVVWGHVHQNYDGWRNGVRLLGAPSTCVQFRPRSHQFSVDDQPPGFRWLQLHADGRIETAVMRIDAYRGDVDLECGGYR